MGVKEIKLTLDIIEIKDIAFGERTQVEQGCLTIHKEELEQAIRTPVFSRLELHLARPGESIRIIPVKDVIEPRAKADSGEGFPGFCGGFSQVGEGVTKVLRGCGVVTAGTIVGFQEGIIDMTGPGADYTHYSKLNNLVLVADVPQGTPAAKHEEALRIAGVKAAHYLATAIGDVKADYQEIYALPPVSQPLPKVGIMYMAMAQGLLHDNFLYGVDAKRLHPTLLHPNELFDGALVNGNCVVAGDKNTTYDHQNNPLIKELFKRHGKELDFKGAILVPTYPGLLDKERCCMAAVKLARLLDLDGVVVPEEGGGNPEADLMMICQGCEQHGIRTALMLGPDGVEEPVADVAPEADAVINVGDCNEFIVLPAMEQIIGCPEQVAFLSGGSEDSLQENGALRVSLSAIMGSVNGLGTSKMTSYVY